VVTEKPPRDDWNPKDVKNEDRPGYVYESTGDGDKMPDNFSDNCDRLSRILQNGADNCARSKRNLAEENGIVDGFHRLGGLLKNDVAAALRRHQLLRSLEIWRGEPAVTLRRKRFSAAA
jgi:hypothetical protein